MLPFPPLVAARLLRRENRFRALVLLADGRQVAAHVPNSGRLREVFTPPGRQAWLRPVDAPHRKTPYDLLLAAGDGGVLISVDARLPNALFADALQAGRFDQWLGAPAARWQVRPEPKVGRGRLDFHLTTPDGQVWWIETKSITLVENGVALFPDAPTARGRRHLTDLCRLVQDGERAAAIFVVQRPDATAFAPHTAVDPAFTAALHEALACGVTVKAYRCQVTLKGIALDTALPILPGR